MAYYEYCRDNGIMLFIDLNGKGGRPPIYKDDFTIDNDGVFLKIYYICSILDNIYFSRFIRPVDLGRQAQDSKSL